MVLLLDINKRYLALASRNNFKLKPHLFTLSLLFRPRGAATKTMPKRKASVRQNSSNPPENQLAKRKDQADTSRSEPENNISVTVKESQVQPRVIPPTQEDVGPMRTNEDQTASGIEHQENAQDGVKKPEKKLIQRYNRPLYICYWDPRINVANTSEKYVTVHEEIRHRVVMEEEDWCSALDSYKGHYYKKMIKRMEFHLGRSVQQEILPNYFEPVLVKEHVYSAPELDPSVKVVTDRTVYVTWKEHTHPDLKELENQFQHVFEHNYSKCPTEEPVEPVEPEPCEFTDIDTDSEYEYEIRDDTPPGSPTILDRPIGKWPLQILLKLHQRFKKSEVDFENSNNYLMADHTFEILDHEHVMVTKFKEDARKKAKEGNIARLTPPLISNMHPTDLDPGIFHRYARIQTYFSGNLDSTKSLKEANEDRAIRLITSPQTMRRFYENAKNFTTASSWNYFFGLGPSKEQQFEEPIIQTQLCVGKLYSGRSPKTNPTKEEQRIKTNLPASSGIQNLVMSTISESRLPAAINPTKSVSSAKEQHADELSSVKSESLSEQTVRIGTFDIRRLVTPAQELPCGAPFTDKRVLEEFVEKESSMKAVSEIKEQPTEMESSEGHDVENTIPIKPDEDATSSELSRDKNILDDLIVKESSLEFSSEGRISEEDKEREMSEDSSKHSFSEISFPPNHAECSSTPPKITKREWPDTSATPRRGLMYCKQSSEKPQSYEMSSEESFVKKVCRHPVPSNGSLIKSKEREKSIELFSHESEANDSEGYRRYLAMRAENSYEGNMHHVVITAKDLERNSYDIKKFKDKQKSSDLDSESMEREWYHEPFSRRNSSRELSREPPCDRKFSGESNVSREKNNENSYDEQHDHDSTDDNNSDEKEETGSESSIDVENQNIEELIREYNSNMYRESSLERFQEEQYLSSEEDEEDELDEQTSKGRSVDLMGADFTADIEEQHYMSDEQDKEDRFRRRRSSDLIEEDNNADRKEEHYMSDEQDDEERFRRRTPDLIEADYTADIREEHQMSHEQDDEDRFRRRSPDLIEADYTADIREEHQMSDEQDDEDRFRRRSPDLLEANYSADIKDQQYMSDEQDDEDRFRKRSPDLMDMVYTADREEECMSDEQDDENRFKRRSPEFIEADYTADREEEYISDEQNDEHRFRRRSPEFIEAEYTADREEQHYMSDEQDNEDRFRRRISDSIDVEDIAVRKESWNESQNGDEDNEGMSGWSTPQPVRQENVQRASGDDDIQFIEHLYSPEQLANKNFMDARLAAAKERLKREKEQRRRAQHAIRELKEYEADEDLLTGKFAPRKVVPVQPSELADAAVFAKHPRRKLPPKNTLEFTRHRQKMKRFVEEAYDLPRPVIYRMRGFNSERIRQFHSKRTRVTRQICNNKITQFHLEDENTDIKTVPDKSLAETIDSYLEESKKHIQKSTRFYDHVLATAVEYDNTVKMLHFGRTLKKHSCKQKRLKFQSSWWFSPKKYRTKKRPKGFFKTPKYFCYKITYDKLLFRNHGTFFDNQPSPIHKIYQELKPRLMRRRTTNDIILDSSYFVREFFLVKSSISLRITRSADIPSCFAPPTLRCGYFPFSAVSLKSKKHYLAERFKEAQMEYLNLTYRKIIPPKGFKAGTITKNELWTFHKLGKHIHGFFVVWMDRHNYYEDGKGTTVNRRYLVDMFSHQHFPLHIKYRCWETRLKMAFDKVTAYNLNLAEVIRANRPVFDTLSQNPSLLKPITLGEIMCSVNIFQLTEQDINPKYYINTVGKQQLYDWGRGSTNADYLSAFAIICGGTKVARPIRNFDLERYRVFKTNAMETGVLTKNGKLFLLHTAHKPKDFLIHIDNFEHEVECEKLPIHPPLSAEGANITRIISDTPQNPTSVPKPKAKKAVREKRICLNRTELIKVRKRIYNLPDTAPVKKEKKKQRKPPGRKADTRVEKGLRSNNFDSAYIASDIESEYEGYLSNEEMTNEVRPPRLVRSQSAESFHLDINYIDYHVNGLSAMHSTKFDFVDHPIAKKKKRKMKRKVTKHTGRFRELQKESHAFKELMECYQGNFPRGVKEVAVTKSSIRNGTYDRNNIPRAYVKGDQPLIDIVFRAVKDLVSSVVGEMHSSARRQIGMARLIQQTCISRIETVENLPTNNSLPLPDAPYLAMEMLARKKIIGRFSLEQEKTNLKKTVGKSVKKYFSFPSYQREYLFELSMLKRSDFEFHAHWKHLMERDTQFDRTLKLLPFDPQSLQALNDKEEKRRQSRKRHAEKIAARKKLVKANATESDFEALNLEIERREKVRAKQELIDKIHAMKLKDKVKKLQEKAERRQQMLENQRMNSYIKESNRRERSLYLAELALEKKNEEHVAKIKKMAEEAEKARQEKIRKQKEEELKAAREAARKLAEEKEKQRLAEEAAKKRKEEERIRKEQEELRKQKEAEKKERQLQLAKERATSMKHARDLNDSRLLKLTEMKIKDIEEHQRQKESKMKLKELRAQRRKRRSFAPERHEKKPSAEPGSKNKKTEEVRKPPAVLGLDDLSIKIAEHRIIRRKFKDSDLLQILREAGEAFYLALKHITSLSLLFFYLQNYVNVSFNLYAMIYIFLFFQTEKRSIDVSENLIHLFDNIAKSFKWHIAEKRWFFDCNLTFLSKNVNAIIKTQIENLMKDSAILHERNVSIRESNDHNSTNQEPRDLLQRDKCRIQPGDVDVNFSNRLNISVIGENNESWVMGPPWVPPVSTNTKFWELMNQSRNAKSLEEEVRWMTLLEKHIFGNQDLPLQSVQWVYAIFGVSCVLLTGKAEDASIAIDPDKTFFLESETLKIPENTSSIESILRHLVTASMYFQEANVYPINTKALCIHSGFKEVITCVKKVYRHIIYIFVRFNVINRFKSGTSVEDALCEVFLEIGNELQSMIETTFNLSSLEVEKLRQSEYHASLNAFAGRGFAVLGAKHSEEQKEYTVMINSVLNWYTAFRNHHNEEYNTLKTDILEHLQCELKAREKTPPGDVFESITPYTEVQCDKSTMKNCEDENKDTGNKLPVVINDDTLHKENRPNRETTIVGEDDPLSPIVSQCVERYDIFPDEPAVRVGARFIINRETDNEYRNLYRKLRAIEIKKENAAPSNLPKFENSYEQSMWRAIERSFSIITEKEKEKMEPYEYIPHVNKTKNRFHMLIRKTKNQESMYPRFILPSDWTAFEKFYVEDDVELFRKVEDDVLTSFKNTVLTKEEFGRMQWSVPQRRGTPMLAIEFFCDLDKYRSQRLFIHQVSTGALPFNFKVYKHLWFMGNLLPMTYNPDSHEHVPDNACAGCTEGSVVIVHKCCCVFQRQDKFDNFIYVDTTMDCENEDVERLVGRFVCEHGPSSVLVLVNKIRSELSGRSFFEKDIDLSQHWDFDCKLRIIKRRTMHETIRSMFANMPPTSTMISESIWKEQPRESEDSSSTRASSRSSALENSPSVEFVSSKESSPISSSTESSSDIHSKSPAIKLSRSLPPQPMRIMSPLPRLQKIAASEPPRPLDNHHQASSFEKISFSSSTQSSPESIYGSDTDSDTELSQFLDTSSSSPQKYPPIVSPSKEKTKNETSASFDRRRNQQTPVRRHGFRMVPLRTFRFFEEKPRFRSKSVECSSSVSKKKQPVFARSLSQCSLNDINKYARRRMENTIKKYDDFDLTETPGVRRTRQKRMRAELLDSRMFEIGGISSCDVRKKCGLITSMLECGSNDKDHEMIAAQPRYKIIVDAASRNSFQSVRGGDKKNLPEYDERGYYKDGDVISLVMNEYHRYLSYVKEKLAAAQQLMEIVLKDAKKLVNSSATMKLYTAHDKIFNMNLFLFEHLLHLICQHTFNPLAIYYAEKNQDVNYIRKSLETQKKNVPMVMDAFFNNEPLKRQLREIAQLEVHYDTETMVNLALELSRIAIERVSFHLTLNIKKIIFFKIRIPQSVRLNRLNNLPWVNAHCRYHDTVDLMRLFPTHWSVSYVEEFKFLAEANHFDANQLLMQLTNFDYTKRAPMGNFFKGFIEQSEQFFGVVADLMPSKCIDIKMKAFYQHQAITKVFEVIKTRKTMLTSSDLEGMSIMNVVVLYNALISNPPYQRSILDSAVYLDLHYKTLKKKEVQFLIQPALIGITFACLEERIHVSLVKEDELITSNSHPLQNAILNKSEIRMVSKAENLKLSMIVDNATNSLSIAFHSQSDPDSYDRAPFGFLPARPRGLPTPWKYVLEKVINPNFNLLSRYLKQQMSMPSKTNLGRVEQPGFNAVEQKENVEQEAIDINPEPLETVVRTVIPLRKPREKEERHVWSISPSLEMKLNLMRFRYF
ncbi:CRE-SDC-2 protein [Caenorhabditis remanei]|uniref:CRE-SDC-2 protein n=1 Tax=Caenorhabditis remanei TaxID=31234 RepID=E3M230_CAERE|nr:CRE-SDC-2 protein [Caenorhabditis remanei]